MQLRVDKAEIYFETCGDTSNPPLVLWNGAGCTLRMWDKVIPGLSSKFYVIAFDIRGAGKSINLMNHWSLFLSINILMI